MLRAQDFRCAICCTETAGGSGDWHVDHCHDSGAVRGLLCMRCNTMLGMVSADTSTLSNAIAYLEANKKEQ